MSSKLSASRLSLLIATLFSATPVFSVDLMQVYREAQSNDQQYVAARATAEAGREKGPQGLAGLLPSINASANTVWNDNDYKRVIAKVKDSNDIARVGTISAGDPEIGRLIAEAMEKVGKEGVITVEESNTSGSTSSSPRACASTRATSPRTS